MIHVGNSLDWHNETSYPISHYRAPCSPDTTTYGMEATWQPSMAWASCDPTLSPAYPDDPKCIAESEKTIQPRRHPSTSASDHRAPRGHRGRLEMGGALARGPPAGSMA